MNMQSRLRDLAPSQFRGTTNRPNTTGLFWCGVFAIVWQFTLSANVMSSTGVNIKVHPATILIAICAVYAFARGLIPLQQRLREAPALMLFVAGIPLVTVYSIYFNGISGATVFIENFWSAGLLALLLEPATPKQRRLLGNIILALVILNVFVALYESFTQTELFSMNFDPDAVEQHADDIVEDFRAHAFYGHPLTASLITAMAIFLLYDSRLPFLIAGPVFGLLLIGLLAFGGRTALGITVIMSVGAALYVLVTGLVRRQLRKDFVFAVIAAIIIIPPVLAVIISQTTIADRIVHNLYYDDSAAVRSTQWLIFDQLTLRDWLFGISKETLANMKYQIELGGQSTDIENCWILIFLDLGAIGFTVFATMLGAFLLHMARYANTLNGWMVMVAALIIDSSSNSLGVWSNDLFLEVAILLAISGYSGYVPAASPRRVRWSLNKLPDVAGRPAGLGIPEPLRLPGLRRP